MPRSCAPVLKLGWSQARTLGIAPSVAQLNALPPHAPPRIRVRSASAKATQGAGRRGHRPVLLTWREYDKRGSGRTRSCERRHVSALATQLRAASAPAEREGCPAARARHSGCGTRPKACAADPCSAAALGPMAKGRASRPAPQRRRRGSPLAERLVLALLVAAFASCCYGLATPPPPPPPASAAAMASALLAFRNALRGPTGTQLGNWSGSSCSASWTGVTCSPTKMPLALSLSGLALAGTLSCDVAAVTTLASINLVRGPPGEAAALGRRWGSAAQPCVGLAPPDGACL